MPSRLPGELGAGQSVTGVEQELAAHAAALLDLCTGRGRPPDWRLPTFRRELELVRLHLSPIREPSLLAASFGRESVLRLQAEPARAAAAGSLRRSAVVVAYAIRWLELVGSATAAAHLFDDGVPGRPGADGGHVNET